jgi:hypothetical protein
VDLRTAQVMSWHSGGDTNATYNRDEWNRLTHGAMGDPYTRSRYYHLYLNGRYWGIYGTQERADSDFAASYFRRREGGLRRDEDLRHSPSRRSRRWRQRRVGAAHNAALAGFTSDAAYFAVQGKDANGVPNGNRPCSMSTTSSITRCCALRGRRRRAGEHWRGRAQEFLRIRPRDGRFGFRFLTHDAESTMISRDVTPTITTAARWPISIRAGSRNSSRRTPNIACASPTARSGTSTAGALDNASALTRWQALRAELSGAMLAESARWGDAKSPSSPRTVAQWNAANDAIETGFIPVRRAEVIGSSARGGCSPRSMHRVSRSWAETSRRVTADDHRARRHHDLLYHERDRPRERGIAGLRRADRAQRRAGDGQGAGEAE